MSRREKEIDFFKYTQLDPLDNEVFFGPITLRELKRSVEVEEEIVRRRLAEKKRKAELAKQSKNEDDVLNRTFEINEHEDQSRSSNIPRRTLNDITQFHNSHDESKLVDLTIQFSKPSMKPLKSVAAGRQSKCLLDETVNFNESKIGGHLRTPLMDRMTRSQAAMFSERQEDSESKENVEPIVGTPKFVPAVKQTKCLLDETINLNESKYVGDLRTPLLDRMTRSQAAMFAKKQEDSEESVVGTPRSMKLSNTFITDLVEPIVGTPRSDTFIKNSVEPVEGTPRLIKLSDTFITDLVGDAVLNATVSDDSETAERVGTPDIFKQERNDVWKNSPRRSVSSRSRIDEPTTCFFARSPTSVVATASLSKKKTPANMKRLLAKSPVVTLGTLSTSGKKPLKSQVALFAKSPAVVAPPFQSKKKTPAENRGNLFPRSPAPSRLLALPKQTASQPTKETNDWALLSRSPVANYINHGQEIKSMSRARHNSCIQKTQDVRSKSDCKIAQSKIPVSISSSCTTKRKLDLGEVRKLRQPLFNSPRN